VSGRNEATGDLAAGKMCQSFCALLSSRVPLGLLSERSQACRQGIVAAARKLNLRVRQEHNRPEASAEEVCDDSVILLGKSRREYAHQLVDMAELSTARLAAAGVGIVSFRSMLGRRVARIMDTSRSLSTRVGGVLFAIVLIAGLIATLLAGLVGIRPNHATAADAASSADDRDAKQVADANVDHTQTDDIVTVRDHVVDQDGMPVAGAHVALIASNRQPRRGDDFGPRSHVIAEAVIDVAGQFDVALPAADASADSPVLLIARIDGAALAWKQLNLKTPQSDIALTLETEAPIRGRLVDLKGQPAGDVTLDLVSVTVTPIRPVTEGAEFDDPAHRPAAWPPEIVTDPDGRFTVYNLAAQHAVLLHVRGSDRFAPQDIWLNSGEPEQRSPRDATYRSIVKNSKPGEEAVIKLSPAKVFEGTVRYADTGEPAPYARLSVWASQQESGGSMSSVGGIADAAGHFHIAPEPGIRFGVAAYPSNGAPYLATDGDELKWDDADQTKTVDVSLDRGVLVRGKVIEKDSGNPIAGASVQYVPRESTAPKSRRHISGWEGIQQTNDRGQFEIVVLPGRGSLFVHGPRNEYVLQETTSNQLNSGRPGGVRDYAHAIQPIEPMLDHSPQDVTLKLTRGATVHGTLVDEQGQPVDQALLVSWRSIHPYWLSWDGETVENTGGQFEFGGLAPGETHDVHFLSAQHQLGATATLRADEPAPRVVLHPCGAATMRTVNKKGEPVPHAPVSVYLIARPGVDRYDWTLMKAGAIAADMDFIQNIDRVSYHHPGSTDSDDQGRLTLPVLIPGATYAIEMNRWGDLAIGKTFVAEAAKRLDLGDVEVESPER
jgi:hypothetical protein